MGSCGADLGRTILILLNSIILLGGIGLLSAGIVVNVDESVINDNVLPLMNDMQLSGLNFGDLVTGLSITCIATGCFLSVLAGLGLFGACCRMKILLFLYGFIVNLIIIAEIVAVVMWFLMHDKLTDWLKTQLLTLLNAYDGDITNEFTMAWNWAFMLLKCCGVNAVVLQNDFQNSAWWASLYRSTQEIPPGCCVGADSSNIASFVNSTCTNFPTSSNSYSNVGCYDTIYDILSTYSTTFIIVCFVIAAVEVLSVVFTIKVYNSVKKTQVDTA